MSCDTFNWFGSLSGDFSGYMLGNFLNWIHLSNECRSVKKVRDLVSGFESGYKVSRNESRVERA